MVSPTAPRMFGPGMPVLGPMSSFPGRGLPLNLDSDAGTPLELRAAHRILKNANAAPDWVQLNKAIQDLISKCRAQRESFERRYQGFTSRLETADPISIPRLRREFSIWYVTSTDDLKSKMLEANEAILKYNLIAPSCTQNHIPFRVEEEIRSLAAECPSPNRSTN